MTTLANITGITRDAFKHTNLTAAQYDGEARPGELVVDLGSYQLYIGNVDGNLNLVGGGNGGGTYSNANVAAYLPIYTGNVTAGNILTDNYLYANGNSIFSNPSFNGNIDLGNLYIIDETIYGKNLNQDISIAPAGNGLVQVPGLSIPVGTILQGTAQVTPVITSLVLNQVLNYSTGPGDTLPAGSYGNPGGVTAPWAVYEFTTTPVPALLVNDVIAGTGVPIPSTVQWVGNTSGVDPANANIVVTTLSYQGLPTPIPATGNIITVARAVTNAGFSITTAANTDIVMTPGNSGVSGSIVVVGNIIPLADNIYSLGSPTNRFNKAYFGGNTIYVFDTALGVDQSISAYNGNLIIGGGTGLNVGQFTFNGNTIAITDPAEDIQVGTELASGNVVFNRPIAVNANIAFPHPTFAVTRSGLVNINPSTTLSPTESALNIVGATSGNIYPRNFNATLIQLTNLDNEPARISMDAFGANAAQNAYGLLAARVARGNVNAPSQTQANDIMMRLTSQGFNNAGVFQGSIVRINQVAAENFTTTAAGTYITFQTTPIGTTTIKTVAKFNDRGFTIPNVAAGGTGLGGITFADNTFQNTAYSPSNSVTSITKGEGFGNTGTYYGNVTLDTIDVHSVSSLSYSLTVSNITANSNYLQLALAQEIAPNSNVTFSNVNITGDLNVTGNTTYGNVSAINDKILYLANNSTTSTQIDGGGIVLGNTTNGNYSVSILYDLNGGSGNTGVWDTDGAGIVTLTLDAQASNVTDLIVSNAVHIGNAASTMDYPNAEVQVDSLRNSYSQIVAINHSPGTSASTDYVAVNDIGNDTSYYVDLGINGSNFNGNSLGWTISGGNAAYLYNSDGDLTIGTASANTNVIFHTGGTLASNIVATISDTGITMANTTVLVQDSLNNDVIELSTNGNIVFNGNSTLRVNNGFYVSSVNPANGNANIVTYSNGQFSYGPALANYSGNLSALNVSVTGNITASGITSTGNVNANYFITGNTTINNGVSTVGNVTTANYFVGDGRYITGLANNSTIISINSNIANTNSNVANTNSNVSNLVTSLANTNSNVANIASNVTILQGLVYSNANVAAYLPIYTGNISANNISTTGNITANYYYGNGSQLTGILTTILPSALSNTIHIAANTVGNTATIITDATTANTANTIVVRDGNGSINVNAWTVNTKLISANYSVTSDDYWIGLTAKNLTITLPGTTTNGRQYIIADCVGSGNPGVNIIASAPANVFNGTLSEQAKTVTATYVSGTWYCNA